MVRLSVSRSCTHNSHISRDFATAISIRNALQLQLTAVPRFVSNYGSLIRKVSIERHQFARAKDLGSIVRTMHELERYLLSSRRPILMVFPPSAIRNDRLDPGRRSL